MEKNRINQHSLIRKNRSAIAVSVILIISLLITAGCINESTGIQTKETEIPDDLKTGLADIEKDISLISNSIQAELGVLAEKFGEADDTDEIRDIGFEFYARNPMINCLIYFDAETGEQVEIPVLIDADLSKYLPFPTKEEIEKNNGSMHLCGQFTTNYGYVEADYRAVYDKDGKYKGYLLLVTDLYVAMNLHPDVLAKDKLYGEYICFLVDDGGKIFYSSVQEAIGKYVNGEKYYFDGVSLINPVKTDTGAYTYTSGAFYNYLRDTQSEKITAWGKFSEIGYNLTVYLVKEIDKPEIQFENVYNLTTEQAIKDVEDVYIYANQKGKQAAIDLVNSGHFKSAIYIMSRDGTVLSCADKGIIGLNFLNNRGVNGYSYVEGAEITAKQGGGYVYYIFPIDGTVDCRAGQCSFAYVIPLDEETYIFGQFAGTTDNFRTGPKIRTGITATARSILKEAAISGVDEVISKINSDPQNAATKFVPDINIQISDIAILDYGGRVHASVMRPELLGHTITDYKDKYGGSTVRKAIMLARNGSGIMPDLSASTVKEGCVDLWSLCVVPINDEYLIIVAGYTGTNEDILADFV